MTERNATPQGMLEASSFGEVLGMKHLPAPSGEARIELVVRPHLCNRHGTVHGGVVMALMDAAGLWAAAEGDRLPRASTVSLGCSFLNAVPCDGDVTLVAEARLSKQGKSLIFSSVSVSAGEGPPIATGQAVYKLLRP